MKSRIKLYRVLLNVLFYMFYILLASIAFSFIFPTILVIFGQDVLDPNNPIFDNIQIGIIIIVLIFTLIFRKYCYLPILNNNTINNVELKKEKNTVEPVKEKEVTEKILEKEKIEKTPELDIKIGKEIK